MQKTYLSFCSAKIGELKYMNLFQKLIEPGKQLDDRQKVFTDAMLKAMIVPLVIEQLLQMVVGLADTMMVSYAGETVVAGVGLDTMIYTIFIYLFTAISAGGSVVVAQYIGSRNRGNSNLAASQIFHLAGFVSLVCMGLMLIFGSALLELMYPATEPETMAACKTYMWIVTLSFPANAIYNAGAALYRTMGRTSVTMRVSLVANLVNVAGNAIGIFVLHAGAAGVAWPTTLSWYTAAIVMTALCFNEKQEVHIELKKMLKPDLVMIRRILGIAIPNSVENTLFQAAKVALGILVATFGTSQIAANSTGQTFWSLAACMGTSMSTVFITVIGQCVGAKDQEAAEWYMRKLTRLSIVLAALWNAAVMVLTPMLLPLYDLSSETKRLILIIVAIHNLFSATIQPFAMPLSAGLRAAGDVQFTMWASIFCTVVCRTLFSFLLASWLGLGVIGIALAMALDWCIKAGLDIWRFRSGKWKNRHVI